MASLVQAQHSFLAGQDLWIVSQKMPSSFFQKLDWLSNFQLSKSIRHESQKRGPALEEWIETTELSVPAQLDSSRSPLVLSFNDLLPCRWLIYLQFESLDSWTQQILPLWQGLGKPSLRMFLPEGEEPNALMNLWKPHDPIEEFTVVNLNLPTS